MPKVSAIVPSAGSGKRMGAGIYKQYLSLGDNPIIVETLKVFQRSPAVDEVVLVAPPGDVEFLERIVGGAGLTKVSRIVVGGRERQDSVGNGLDAVDPSTEIVVIHDGVRPFPGRNVLEETVSAARRYGAAIAAVPVKETVKEVGEGSIIRTVPRDDLWLAQTPQVFRYDIIRRAFDNARKKGITATDDSALVEALGMEVRIVKGSYGNIKITTPEDLVVAEAFLNGARR